MLWVFEAVHSTVATHFHYTAVVILSAFNFFFFVAFEPF